MYVARRSTGSSIAARLRVRATFDLLAQALDELADRRGSQVAPAVLAHGDLPALLFLIADDQHVGNLAQLGVAELASDRLGALVDLGPGARVSELDRAGPPRAPERIAHMQVDLGAVEGSVTRVDVVAEALTVEHLDQVSLSPIPLLVRAEPLLGTGRKLEADVEAEDLVRVER